MKFSIAEKTLRHIITSARSLPKLENVAVLQSIWNYRNYYRPDKVKLVVLAESHVYTHPLTSCTYSSACLGLSSLVPQLSDYVKFFYCLGYGEEAHCLPPPISSVKSGTPQYWKLMRSVLGCSLKVLKKEERNDFTRIENKLKFLACLRCSGIWLLDASFFAVNGSIFSRSNRNFILSAHIPHILGILKAVNNPPVVLVGKNVQDTYEGILPQIGIRSLTSIPQPNARLKYSLSGIASQLDAFRNKIKLDTCCSGAFCKHDYVPWSMPPELEWDGCSCLE